MAFNQRHRTGIDRTGREQQILINQPFTHIHLLTLGQVTNSALGDPFGFDVVEWVVVLDPIIRFFETDGVNVDHELQQLFGIR